MASSVTLKKVLVALHFGLAILAGFALLLIVTNGSTAAFPQAGAEGESLSPSDFLRLYREVLDRQRARYHDARVDGEMRGRIDWPKKDAKGNNPREGRPQTSQGSLPFSLVSSGLNEKLRVTRTGDKPMDAVTVSSGPHTFRVHRGTPGGAYMLDRSQTKGGGLGMTERLRQQVLNAPHSPAGLPDFPAYVMDPQFEVKHVVRTTGSEAPVVMYFFRYLPNQKKKPNLEGWVRLEGASDWVIRDYELEATWWPLDQKKKYVSKHSGSILYTQKNGVSVPVEIRYSEQQNSGMVEEDVFQIDSFTLGPTPPEEFTLAAFGLGDFERPMPRATNRGTYYLALFGATALVLSFVLAAIARYRWGQRADGSVPSGGPI